MTQNISRTIQDIPCTKQDIPHTTQDISHLSKRETKIYGNNAKYNVSTSDHSIRVSLNTTTFSKTNPQNVKNLKLVAGQIQRKIRPKNTSHTNLPGTAKKADERAFPPLHHTNSRKIRNEHLRTKLGINPASPQTDYKFSPKVTAFPPHTSNTYKMNQHIPKLRSSPN